MSSKSDVVRAWHEASWVNPPSSITEAAEKYFSEDYQGLDKDGNVNSDKAGYIGASKLILNAFEDFKAEVHDLGDEDDSVVMTFHWEGTHTGDLDLSPMGLGVFPATGKWVETDGKSRVMVEGDQITGIQPISGGMESLIGTLMSEKQSV